MVTLERYQLAAVDHLWQVGRGGLFFEMGTGKTAAALAAITPEHLPVLVVAPKRVAELTWPTELEKFRPDLSHQLAAGSPAQRREALTWGADVTIIGRDNAKDALAKGCPRWRTIIIDELSGYKDRGTARHKYMRWLVKKAVYVWGLTGTPMPMSPGDLWAQLYLLDGGERLGTSLTQFRERWQTPGPRLPSGIVTRWDMRPGAVEDITARISDICLSETSARVLDLPAIVYEREPVRMSSPASAAYRRMKAELVTTLASGDVLTAASAAVAQGKLSQLASGFIYGETGEVAERYDTEKIDALTEVWDGIGRQNVLVFYQFKAELATLRERFPSARAATDPGAIEAWQRGEVSMLLAHPASAGHGLNLQTGGHHSIWLTLPWSTEHWAQANARLHRRGQTRPVIVHYLEAIDTVDAVKWDKLMKRTDGQDKLMQHLLMP